MSFNSNTNLVHQFIIGRKLKTLTIIILGIISNILTIIIPVSIGKYYELVFHYKSHRTKTLDFIPSSIWDTVPKFLLFLITFVILRYLFFFLYEFFLKKESEVFVKEIKDFLFNHQLRVEYAIYQEKGIGKYLLRYTGDINSLKNLYLKGSIRLFIDAIMIIIALSWLYTLNSKGAIAIIILSFVSYLIVRTINKKVEFYSLEKRNKNSGQLSYVSRTLNSILNVILFNKQEIEFKKYKKKSNSVKDAAIVYDKWIVISKGFISFIQYGILCVILYVFYVDTIQDTTQKGAANLISFILLYITILPIIRRLFTLETVYKLGNISLNKLNTIIKLQSEQIESGEILSIKNPRVKFEDVKFNNSVAINFSSKKMALSVLKLPKGVDPMKIIAALTKLSNEYKGVIKINNENIQTFSPKSLRDNITVLSSDIPLTGRTVYEVITEFRSKRIKENTTNLFCEIQLLFSNIPQLDIDENIGENGSKLSTSQHELLCFVRGAISNKRIFLINGFPLLFSNNYDGIISFLEKKHATIIRLES